MSDTGAQHPDVKQLGGTAKLRARSHLAAFGLVTALGILLCVYVAYPFLPALAWALALAVMAFPMHIRLEKVIPSRTAAAAVSTVVVVAVLLAPVLVIAEQFAREASGVSERAKGMDPQQQVEAVAQRMPYGHAAVAWVRENVDVQSEARNVVRHFAGDAAALAQGSAWAAVQLLICVVSLFYALRDWRHLLGSMRGLSPISRDETDYLFRRVADSIYATIYAEVVVSVIQGITGGLLFWWLGLPAPVLWGVVMAILGLLPVVGAPLVWVPAAVVLVSEDRWGAAVALVSWGLLMAGPVSYYLYGVLAGGRLRLHELPVLIAFVGGLVVFGVAGVVVGPVILAVVMGMLDVWQRRLHPEAPDDPIEEAKAADRGGVPAGVATS